MNVLRNTHPVLVIVIRPSRESIYQDIDRFLVAAVVASGGLGKISRERIENLQLERLVQTDVSRAEGVTLTSPL